MCRQVSLSQFSVTVITLVSNKAVKVTAIQMSGSNCSHDVIYWCKSGKKNDTHVHCNFDFFAKLLISNGLDPPAGWFWLAWLCV